MFIQEAALLSEFLSLYRFIQVYLEASMYMSGYKLMIICLDEICLYRF
jgi:hypothetical protein